MNTVPIDPSATVDSLVTKGGPPRSSAEGSSTPRRVINLVGQRFGRLTVLAFHSSTPSTKWTCRCDCGQIHIARACALRTGNTKSCGCYRRDKAARAQYRDLTGQRFGRLTVKSAVLTKSRVRWSCLCDCGALRIVDARSLVSGRTSSCGCLCRERRRARIFQDLTGQRFGRWVVESLQNQKGPARWHCTCDCGVRKTILARDLKSGHSRSCGCLKNEATRARSLNPALSNQHRERNRIERYGNEAWALLSQQVLARDNHTCFICGERGGRLNAHHLEPWAENISLRYAEANLVTLCTPCHSAYHKLYGDDCGLEDFEEFTHDFKET